MNHGTCICCICKNEAIRAAANELQRIGLNVVFTPYYECDHLLLPVPSFPAVDSQIQAILSRCRTDTVVSGGKLDDPRLSGYHTIDFLKDEEYLSQNAAITARCAIALAESQYYTPVSQKQVLVLGFGRIGKCLCRELSTKGAKVAVAARKERDLATISALGAHAVPISAVAPYAEHADLIFNTVPAMVLPQWEQSKDTLAIELASSPGMRGEDIISAKGLPAKMAPEESGRLIAETFVRLSL